MRISPVRRTAVVLASLLAATSVVATTAGTASAATNSTISFSLDRSYLYAVGMDKVYAGGTSPGGYEKIYEYPQKRPATNPSTTLLPNPPSVNVTDAQTLQQIRLEFYRRCQISVCTDQSSSPNYYQYRMQDPGDSMVAMRITPAARVNLGTIPFPKPTDANYATLTLNAVSRKPMFDSRLKITIFQTTGQPKTSAGFPVDAEAHGYSVGSQWKSTGLWNGKYLAFIYDYENGLNQPYTHRILGLINVQGATTFTLDLDATCFGIDECLTTEPSPPTDGEFHAVTPTRIVDSRANRGVTGGMVQPGDGRLNDPNPVHRLATRMNHDFRVTGVGGVPAAGVSAVLLNVTVLGGTQNGSLAVYPKPPRAGSVFQDQGSYFSGLPSLQSQVFWKPGDVTTGQVLVRPGAGGVVRIVNRSTAGTHVLVDVLGWFDQSQPGQNGLGLVAVQPARVVDTRVGAGTTASAFVANSQRSITLRPSGPVAADAGALVGALSVSPVRGNTFLTVWPSGAPRPVVASVSATPGLARSNMVTSPLSSGGAWGIFDGPTAAHVSVDVSGYFATRAGTTGRVTVINATKAYGTAAVGANAVATVNLAGKLGGAANPVAAYVNVTMASNVTGGVTLDAVTPPTTALSARYTAGRPSASLVLVRLNPDGTFRLRNLGAGAVNITIDLVAVVNG